MTPETAIAMLTAVGLGGILGAFFQARFEHQKKVKEHEHDEKIRRYKVILILLLTKLDPNERLEKTRTIRPDLKNINDLDEEIEAEFLNGLLFASDDVIKSMAKFIRNPNHDSYAKTALAMRKDLWGGKTTIEEQILDVLQTNAPSKSKNEN